VQLVLVLLLLLLPACHLVFHGYRGEVDVVLEVATLGLNILNLRIQVSLDLRHLLGNDYLDVSLVQTFFDHISFAFFVLY